jgi:hypothetical protein
LSNNNYLYRRGTTPNTRVAVSQKNKIFSVGVNRSTFEQIGVTSSFSFNESRSIDPVRGLGYGDQVAELVPGVTSEMSLSLNRTLLYLSNLHQVLGYKGGVDGLVRSLKHHQWPFDLKHELVFSRIATNEAVAPKLVAPASDGVNEALLTFFEACWIESYSASFSADSALISEDVGIKATDVIDGSSTYGELAADALSTGNSPFADAGSSFRFSTQGALAPSNLV